MRYNEEGVTGISKELINESEDKGVRELGKRSVIEMFPHLQAATYE